MLPLFASSGKKQNELGQFSPVSQDTYEYVINFCWKAHTTGGFQVSVMLKLLLNCFMWDECQNESGMTCDFSWKAQSSPFQSACHWTFSSDWPYITTCNFFKALLSEDFSQGLCRYNLTANLHMNNTCLSDSSCKHSLLVQKVGKILNRGHYTHAQITKIFSTKLKLTHSISWLLSIGAAVATSVAAEWRRGLNKSFSCFRKAN